MKPLTTTSNGHYYASSIGRWRVDTDMDKLRKAMELDRLTFTVWYVPAPITAKYEIHRYAPVDMNAICIGQVDMNNDAQTFKRFRKEN